MISFIIGYRHSRERLKNLRKTIKWLNQFKNIEIILVEQDKHSKIQEINLECKKFFTKSNMPFNRSWALNIGLSYSTKDFIVFGDSDIFMKPNDFLKALKELEKNEMVSPYNKMIDLSESENNLNFDEIYKIDRTGRGELDNQKINISSGISMYRRSAIEKIKGWDESFVGWGGEDNLQTYKVKRFLKYTEMEAPCYHLNHPIYAVDMEHYNRSLDVLNQVFSLSDEDLVKYVNSKKIGKLNKYE